MIHKQAPQALAGLALLLSLSVGCAGGADPAAPGSDSDNPLGPGPSDSGIPSAPDAADDEPYIREVTSLSEGTKSLNGSIVTFPGYQAQPGVVSTPTVGGELIFFRHRPRMSDSSTNLNLATNYFSQLMDYGNITTPAGNLSSFEVRYAVNTEPIEVNMWNSNTPNGSLNGPAVVWDYTIKTSPALSSEEPDSDNNTSSVFDRTMANPIALGQIINRSMYSFSPTQLDVEEWWKVNLIAGTRYTINVGTYHPRYGTWKYRIHVRNPNGAANAGGNLFVEPLDTTGQLTFLADTTGTHYIQMAGYRRTRTESSNVYYSPYSLQVSANLPPTATVTPAAAEFLSGITAPQDMVTLNFSAVNDPEGKVVSVQIDWNSDGDFDDLEEAAVVLSPNGSQIRSPLFYSNPSSLITMPVTLTYHLSDGSNNIATKTVDVTIGRNRRPNYEGTFVLQTSTIAIGQMFNLQVINGTGPSDPEGDPFSFFVRSEVMTSNGITGGGDNTGDFEAQLRGLGYSQSPSMGPFGATVPFISDVVRISIWLDDAGHNSRALDQRVGDVTGTVHS